MSPSPTTSPLPLLILTLFTLLTLFTSTPALAAPLAKRAVSFFNPLDNGGSMLIDAGDGFGEPLNVIISGLSSPHVLTESGFINFVRSIGFSTECLGLHSGAPFSANLGDGNGPVNQTVEIREDFGQPFLTGTCEESLTGGDHMRLFVQNGTQANSGALFLAVSSEEDVFEGHTIEPNGYDIGRDTLVNRATKSNTNFLGITYSTTAQNVTGLLQPGSQGVNHNVSIDGVVAVLTVNIVSMVF